MATNPLDAISTPVQPQAAPQRRAIPRVIQGPPRQPAPQTAPQVQGDINSAANSGANAARTTALTPYEVEKARREAAAAAATEARGGLTPEQFNERQQRLARLRSASERLLSVGRRYTTRYRDSDYPISLPGFMSPENQAFDADSAALVADVFSIARVPGVGSQSDREQQAFNDAYLPQSGYYDQTNETRLDSIQNLLNEQRQAAGLPPIDWRSEGAMGVGSRGGDAGAGGLRSVRAAQNPTPAIPSPGGGVNRSAPLPDVMGVNGQNVVSGEGGAVASDADFQRAGAEASRLTALVRSGAPIEQIQGYLQSIGRNPLPPEQVTRIEALRRRGQSRSHPPFAADVNPTSRSEPTLVSEFGASAPGAFTINALDSASLGLPGLFSEDYRNGIQSVREANPGASIAGSVAGSLFTPGGVGRTLAQQTVRGGAQGGIYGFNSSGGDLENALVGAGIGTVAPAAFRGVGTASRRTFNALTGRSPQLPAQADDIAQAAIEESIPISRPIIDPRSRDRMAYLESSPGTGNVIREGLEATREGIERRAGALGAGGTAEDLGVMGQRVQDAGRRYIDSSRTQAARMYDRAAQMAGDARIFPVRASQVLHRNIAELAETPGGPPRVLSELQDSFISPDGFTVAGLRNLRTRLRDDFATQGLTGSDIERRAMQVVEALSEDINTSLTRAGRPAAAQAYRRADRFYAERQAEIRQVVQRVIGRKNDTLSGEQVMARLRTMAGNSGDSDRLSRLWTKLSPEEQLDAAATIAETAGRRTAEEGFTPGQFITWSRTLSPAARQTIFGPEGARSISNLRALSKAYQDTASRLNNSRSGMVANWGAAFRDMLRGGPLGAGLGLAAGGSAMTSGATGLVLGAATAGGGMLLRRLSARALMNPDVSRWLATAPRATTPSAIRAHIQRLEPIARIGRNQSIAQEILGLRQGLLNAVNDNASVVTRSAASGDGTDSYGD